MTLPLEGVRVADFTWVWAGPFCTLQLAHLGAEVIRVESRTRTCVTRLLPPFADGTPGPNRSGYFNQYNQGKLSLALDLKRPEGIAVAKDLVAQCDIVCENFAAGVMDRMGLGYDVLRQLRPDLVMIALSGYGATGPDAEFVSYGPAQVPLSGMSSLTGYKDWPPMHVGISYGDPAPAVCTARSRCWRRSGTVPPPARASTSTSRSGETSIATLGEGVLEQSHRHPAGVRAGNRDPQMAPHGISSLRRRAALGGDRGARRRRPAPPRHLHGRTGAGERSALRHPRRARRTRTLEALVSEWTRTQGDNAVANALQAAGVPADVAMTNQDLAEDEAQAQRLPRLP
ncbi:MAG: CoA transferase [Candidatus Binatia bacterium]